VELASSGLITPQLSGEARLCQAVVGHHHDRKHSRSASRPAQPAHRLRPQLKGPAVTAFAIDNRDSSDLPNSRPGGLSARGI